MASLQSQDIDREKIKATCKVIVDGQDVTSRWTPFLLSVQIVSPTRAFDMADLELSDRHGVLKLPDLQKKVQIELGWGSTVKTFDGTIENRESYGQRKGGRRLNIHAKGSDVAGKIKQPQRDTIGEGEKPDGSKDSIKLDDAFQRFASRAGMQAILGEGLKDITRPSWSITNESFMAWARRIAREHGAVFKMSNDTAFLSKLGDSKNAQGQGLADIQATWAADGNLKAWRIKPSSGRPAWKNTNASWFDRLEGKRRYANAKIEGLLGDFNGLKNVASFFQQFDAHTEEQAKAMASGESAAAQNHFGEGWVVIKGEPRAQPEAKCTVKGVRDGVDGDYKIRTVTHTYKRGGGFETLLDIEQPFTQGDTRGDKLAPLT
jgi:phage protein D